MKRKLITAIRIKGLFGIYSYSLPVEGQLSNAAILCGDNGVGKSTLLRLVFHLLSVSNEKGHRTALLNTEFDELEVDLDSGITLVAAHKSKEDFTFLRLLIQRGSKVLAYWDHLPKGHHQIWDNEEFVVLVDERGKKFRRKLASNDKGNEIDAPEGNEFYLETLSKHVPLMFILNAERRLDSDDVSDPSDEMQLRRILHSETPKRMNEILARSREIALSQAMAFAAHWIGSKAIKGTNQGSMNVHSVYVDILHHLLSTPEKQNDEITAPEASLTQKLKAIQDQMEKHSAYELATKLSTSEFQKALVKDKSPGQIASNLLALQQNLWVNLGSGKSPSV